MFGALPAYGLVVRHAEAVCLRDLRFSTAENFWRLTTDVYRDIQWPHDETPPSHSEPARAGIALYCEDVQGLQLEGLSAPPAESGECMRFETFVRIRDPASHFAGVSAAFPGQPRAVIRSKAAEARCPSRKARASSSPMSRRVWTLSNTSSRSVPLISAA